jgi:hypothetical protein
MRAIINEVFSVDFAEDVGRLTDLKSLKIDHLMRPQKSDWLETRTRLIISVQKTRVNLKN